MIRCSCAHLNDQAAEALLQEAKQQGLLETPDPALPEKKQFARVASAVNKHVKKRHVEMQSGEDVARGKTWCGGCRLEHDTFEQMTGQKPPF
ncbi:MAG: hypothetical protein AAF658_17135 [Myxococcota bacterium]